MLNRRTALAGIAALAASPAFSQDRLALKRVRVNGRRISYLVRRAGNVSAPMLLCFGGGNANRGIMEYFEQAYTPATVYQDHHVILPIGPERQLFFQFDNNDARELLDEITKAEKITGRGLIAGVSNGGRAAFTFARAAPEAFRGFITMPGAMGGLVTPAAWRDYAIVLAYGTQDQKWKAETSRAYAFLRSRVGAIEQVALRGQGHVIDPTFDIDPAYARLKALEGRLGR